MGKGDRKSRRGKLWRGSYGKRRPRPSKQKEKQGERNKKKKSK